MACGTAGWAVAYEPKIHSSNAQNSQLFEHLLPHFNYIKRHKHSKFLKMGQPRPLFRLFSVFFKQTSLQFLLQIYVEKCPSSIRCRDSNPRPLERESLPFTTRPGLPLEILINSLWALIITLANILTRNLQSMWTFFKLTTD